MNSLELHQIITGDNQTYTLNTFSKARYMLSNTPAGWGLPEYDDITERSYQQDGVNFLGYYLRPRQFNLQIGAEGCSRSELFTLRRLLLDIFRPNRGKQLTYIFQNADMQRYALQGNCISLPFEQDLEDWYEFGYQTPLTIRCYDPTWYDPDADVNVATSVQADELVFPITFDDDGIYFGDADLFAELAINYTGSWYSYPVIVVSGPFNTLTIFHVQTGYTISYLGLASVGQSVTFDLRNSYSSTGQHLGWRVYNQAGTDVGKLLSPNTNLLRFRIEPDGIVPNGLNTLQFSALGTTPQTTVSITYNTRYIGR